MFYYLLSGLMTYNIILVAAAVVPAVILMIKVYRSDRLDPEPPAMLRELVKAGVLSALIALVEERVLCALLDLALPKSSMWYNVILYFGIVAFAEESSKYLMLKRHSWLSPEFNCQFDGLVYAVFVSLGFALWENISYVLHFGFQTAIVRSLTAIPGHACFGVFMGAFYGLARRSENRGETGKSKLLRTLSVLVPILLHGAYDYIASVGGNALYFFAFIAALFLISYRYVAKASKQDRYI